ncbi:TrlF family AAA-like ATPase [Methylocystis sp. IM4]|uniref:TrlF family AAA-like ATPase n=1 Tax=Methylocystis sp. IM4 TaxID=3136560 RepID=UPI003119E6C9
MAGRIARGSMWRRWDPHIHAPGTILADQYPAEGGWDQFLSRIEESDPPVRALGVTDYYSTATYTRVMEFKRDGRLPEVDLIFPNVELRLGVGVPRGAPINIHLLTSPEDPDHLAQLHRFLASLEFEALGERYRCTQEDLIRLGRAHDETAIFDRDALSVGANQFKVDLANLRDAFDKSAWARANILVGVAASRHDGTSGLQGDDSFARTRREIERFADVIFSSRPADRDFWVGKGAVSLETLHAEYNGPKPCLHGSDAHRPDKVAAPDQDRRCWLKGELTFETLRQACLEPETRAFVGVSAPQSASPAQAISQVEINGATFIETPSLPLNPGLVGIIGPRGSGKTALADLLAAGGGAFTINANPRSFIDRAFEHLSGASVDLEWGGASTTGCSLDELDEQEEDAPRLRYLSQQFVDRLCSAEGLTDELLEEIQRVVFLAHPTEERMGAINFGQLLDLRAEGARLQRAQAESELQVLSEELVTEREREASLGSLKTKLKELEKRINGARESRKTLVAKAGGSADRLEQYGRITTALQTRRSAYEQLERRKNALQLLADDVQLARTRRFPEQLREWKTRHQTAQLPAALWPLFAYQFSGDVDTAIAKENERVLSTMKDLVGAPITPPADGPPSTTTLIPEGKIPETLAISLLQAEAKRLEALIGVDSQTNRALTLLNSRIATDESQAANLRRQIAEAEKAPARIADINKERRTAYANVFEALVAEQTELTRLYTPLGERLAGETGSAGKLSFDVRRRVDVNKWAERGERLLDLRKGSTFRRGSLAGLARQHLEAAWATGAASDASAALAAFREKHDRSITECCPYNLHDSTDSENVRTWAGDISRWLYSTDHIEIAYGVQYDGVDVERLSPGTRGVVLLLLYLVIDIDDDRPLLIDQPEENLDPRSIFVELVDRFRSAKQRRQIIIVTHNANLIVNTDADQVIIANCGPHRPNHLPKISYICGGLEDPDIRAKVCDILEGGEEAFKERAKRLRVNL